MTTDIARRAQLRVAPEGAVAPGTGTEDDLVVQRRDRRADERPDPEDPLRHTDEQAMQLQLQCQFRPIYQPGMRNKGSILAQFGSKVVTT